MPGMRRSVTRTSYGCFASSASASSPLVTKDLFQLPRSGRRTLRRLSRTSGSSSTKRIWLSGDTVDHRPDLRIP